MDDKDIKIQALEQELADTINQKLQLRQQLVAFQLHYQEEDKEE